MKKMFSTGCVLLLLASVVLGCASSSKGAGEATAGGTGTAQTGGAGGGADGLSEKLDITWMVRAFQGGGWSEDHPMIQALNEKFNVNLKIQWVPAANYQEKLNVMAASNDFPDAFYVLYNEYNKWKKQGLFMDILPVLEQYPNLAAIPQEALRKLNPQDRMFGLPFYLTEARDSLSIREDWLKKLDLEMPTNLDELFVVAKAFATQDPDGNKQHDTTGISFYIDSATNRIMEAEHIMAGFGLANLWFEQDGKLMPYQTQTEEWKSFLAYMNKAYVEGVLDKDFAVNKIRAVLEKFEGNKIGISYLNPNQWNESIDKVTRLDPNAVVTPIEPPAGPTGLTGTWTLPMLDKFAINGHIDDKKQQRILMILDYFLSPEGSDFIKHGIEGVHYNKVSEDRYEKLEAADKDRQNLLNNWVYRPFDPGIQMYKWEDTAKHEMIRGMFATNEKHKWNNPAAGLESDTMNKSGANLDMKFMEAATKIIMGQLPVDAIEQASADWLAGGGNKIIEEINASYNG
ncbi:extracellular solute-binding protein [Cohnella sp.]|uniref:extracellular solute-binding protein n=1 Tax=Cohnella sp. TaxID=1883426 RepID=UPI00356AED03